MLTLEVQALEMLARADETVAKDDPPPAAAPAVPQGITVESFPGLCMGASMLGSLALHKIGYGALTPAEGDALTYSALKANKAGVVTERVTLVRSISQTPLPGHDAH